jgi:hypothetical protein
MDEKSYENTPKSQKRKTIHTTWRRDSRTKIRYIERIKCLQGVETGTTSSHSLDDLRDLSFSLFSSPLLHHGSTTTPLKKQLWVGVRAEWLNAYLFTNPWGPIYTKTND